MGKKIYKKPQREIAIELKNINKRYTLHHEKPTFIENVFRNNHQEEFTALDNISLTVYKGEKVGIMGHNGAGKTTLLKVIAGITTPNQGEVRIKGKVASLIDLGAGFHPDLTGQENIFLNGLVIGMSKNKVSHNMAKIVDFADIGDFIDAPLYTYSAGMKLRLGFSVAIHADPEIILLDESVLSGDANFMNKVKKKIDTLSSKGATILMVTHWIEYLKKNCEKFVVMDKAFIVEKGGKEVANKYLRNNAKG